MGNSESDRHNRKSLRLKGYDYAQEGMYFITICTQFGMHRFGHIQDGEMRLNEEGRIVASEWFKSEQLRENVRLHEFVVMPNHIHGIIEIVQNLGNVEQIGKFKTPSNNIGAIVRGFKTASTIRIKKLHEELSINGNKGNEEDPKQIRNQSVQNQIKLMRIPRDGKIWHRNYDDRIIRDHVHFVYVSNYIKNNPKNWKHDLNNK